MPKGTNQKYKLYRLAQIMLERTDDEHYITMSEIKEALGEYDITADRKSLYADLKDLEVLGVEFEGEPVKNKYHYHVVSRMFELPELKLLVDAIQSSKFITEKKSNTLIKKLEKLVSKYEAQKLQRQVYVSSRIKTMNEGKNLVINARAESVMDKPSFRNGILYHHILIPASGFYEWNRLKEKNTFSRYDAPVLYMAGFCDWFENERRFVIMTTAANESMIKVHDRMPLILEKGQLKDWFDDRKMEQILHQVPVQLKREAEYEQQSLFL